MTLDLMAEHQFADWEQRKGQELIDGDVFDTIDITHVGDPECYRVVCQIRAKATAAQRNADLIAAAPELLAVALQLIDAVDLGDTFGTLGIDEELIELARTAIAKATGQEVTAR